jgi:hypothetical protein
MESWSIDKKVPLAILIALAVQLAAGIWWLSGVVRYVEDHERRIARQESADLPQRMAVMESQLREINKSQDSIHSKLDYLLLKKQRESK